MVQFITTANGQNMREGGFDEETGKCGEGKIISYFVESVLLVRCS